MRATRLSLVQMRRFSGRGFGTHVEGALDLVGVEGADDLDGLGGQWLRGAAFVAVVPDETRLLGLGVIRSGLVGQKGVLGERAFG